MTTTEIQALVDGVKSFGRYLASDVPYLIDAIETLLARDNIKTFAEQEVRIAELERRLDAVVKELGTAMIHSNPAFVGQHIMAALAIAEGRDNG